MARAMAAGSWARFTEVATRTPSQPSSMARAASDAVPMPASRITGISTASRRSEMLWGLRMPSPLPMGEPRGMTAAHPTCCRRKARTGSSVVYGRTTNPSSASCSAAVSSSTASGSRVRSSPITSNLTQSVPKASRANLAVSTASDAVAQPAVLGSTRTPCSCRRDNSEPRAAASTRRTATVAMAVPDARSAAPRTSRLVMPPVPRMRREPSTSPAMQRPLSGGVGVAGPASLRVTGRRYPVPAYGGSVPDQTPPTALTIAGSDSGGGAGAQADLKTFAALRVYGTCALTAVTAQNTAEVRGVVALEPAFVRHQVETVLDDFAVASVKTGMLATAAAVAVVSDLAQRGLLPRLVVDPVLVSSTGHRLLEPAGVAAYLQQLLPYALVVTPNLREAAVLGDTDVESLRPLEAR